MIQSGADNATRAIDNPIVNRTTVTIYQHYDLLYWWIVWAYAAFCGLATRYLGSGVQIGDHNVMIHGSPWIGVSFVFVLLFVVIFTNLRARGAMSAVLVLMVVVLSGGLQWLFGWDEIFKLFPLLKVHMNLAFYVTFFVVLLPTWLLTTFLLNRLQYWSFSHGNQIKIGNPIGERQRMFVAHNIAVTKLPDDIFVHRILGLWWLGGGTGDLEISFTTPNGAIENHVIKNVWKASRRQREIQAAIAR